MFNLVNLSCRYSIHTVLLSEKRIICFELRFVPCCRLSPAGEISKISLPDLPNETEQTTDASDVQFAREKGCKKYRHALKMLYPYRCNEEYVL